MIIEPFSPFLELRLFSYSSLNSTSSYQLLTVLVIQCGFSDPFISFAFFVPTEQPFLLKEQSFILLLRNSSLEPFMNGLPITSSGDNYLKQVLVDTSILQSAHKFCKALGTSL